MIPPNRIHLQAAKCQLLNAALPSSFFRPLWVRSLPITILDIHPTSCSINFIIQILIIIMGPIEGGERKGTNIIIIIVIRRRRRIEETGVLNWLGTSGMTELPEGHLSLMHQLCWAKVTLANANNVRQHSETHLTGPLCL